MIHRPVSVLIAIEKRYKPSDAACERRSIHHVGIPTTRRAIRLCRSSWATHSPLRGGVRRQPSETVCKAACLNTQQTVKNDLNRPCRGAAAVLRSSFYSKAFIQTTV